MKLLHIDSSALGQHSVSRGLTADIVAALRRAHAGVELTYRDLAAEPLPHWTPVVDAGDPAFRLGADVLNEFLAADLIVVGAPMYNFSIASQLKAWLDRVLVAGKTFRYGADGPEGLAGGKRVIVASSRGGHYSEGAAAAMDFQEPYLRAALGFIGITDIQFVRAEGVARGEDQKQSALRRANEAIDALERKAA